MIVAGAEVELRPSADGFGARAAAELRSSSGAFRAAGQDIGETTGRAAGDGFGDEFWRSSDGRLRDGRGRFVAEGQDMGRDAGQAAGREFGDAAGRDGGRIKKGFGGLGALAVGGFAAALTAGFVAAPVLGFFKDAVSGATDLAEAQNKINVVFGQEGADAIRTFADDAVLGLGQTRLQAIDAAATFGVFGKSAKLSGKELVGFSSEMSTLSADLASFYNTSPEDAIESIGAALRGESEPIRKYGVLLDDATLRNRALKLGLIDSTKTALTPANKVLAAQAEILAQTTDAQGDFARTSGGLANQQRILSAQWSELKTTIGNALLPAVLAVVLAINGALGPAMTRISELLSGGGGLGEGLGRIGALFTTVSALLLTTFGPAIADIQAMVTGQLLPGFLAFAAFMTASLLPVFLQVWGIISGNILPILGSLASFVTGQLIPAVLAIVASVAAKLQPVFEALVDLVQSRVLPAVQDLLVKWAEWQPTLERVVMVVIKVIGWILNLAAAILGKVLPPVIKFIGWLLGGLVSAIGTVIGWLVKFIGWLLDVGSSLVNAGNKAGEFAARVRAKISDAMGYIKSIPGKARSALGDLGRTLWNAGARLIQGLIDGIKSRISGITSAMGSVASAIADFMPGSPVKRGPLTSWNRGGAGQRLVGLLASGLEDRAKAEAAARRLAEAVNGSLGLDLSPAQARAVAGAISPSGAVSTSGRGSMNVSLSTRVSAEEVLPILRALDDLDDALYPDLSAAG